MQLVSAGSFTWVYQAHLARALLDDRGLTAFVHDDNIVTVDPLASTAYGGVRVMVPVHEADRARGLLRDAETGLQIPEDPSTDPLWPALGIKASDFAPSPAGGREEMARDLARRAYVAAVFGVYLLPFHVYALILLARLATAGVALDRAARRHATAAATISVTALVALWILFR